MGNNNWDQSVDLLRTKFATIDSIVCKRYPENTAMRRRWESIRHRLQGPSHGSFMISDVDKLLLDYNVLVADIQRDIPAATVANLHEMFLEKLSQIRPAVERQFGVGSYQRNAIEKLDRALLEWGPLRRRILDAGGSTENLSQNERARISAILKDFKDAAAVAAEVDLY